MADEAKTVDKAKEDAALLKSLSGFEKTAFDSVTSDTNEYNALFGQIESVSGDPQALLENLRETSKTPAVVASRKKIAELTEALFAEEQKRDAVLKTEVDKIREDAAGKVEELTNEMEAIDERASAGRNYLKKLRPDVVHLLPTKAHAKRAGGGKGSGGRRIRGYNVVVNGKQYANVSEAAKDLSVDAKVLQTPFFDKVGDTRPDSVQVNAVINNTETTVTFNKAA